MSALVARARGKFGSNLGFILAAAGSAVGLGNIWGFPYKAAQSGGGAFVILYLLCVALIGLPVLLAELSIGRATQKSPVGAFTKLAPGTGWPILGGLCVATGFAILAFYSVIAGWVLGYLYKAITGQFRGGLDMAESTRIFDGLTGSGGQTVLWTTLFFILTMLVVRGGIRGGIERASRILMPLFFLLLAGLVIRALTLPGAMGGVRFLFNTDFHKITPTVVLDALSQALFSMSLGMGAMITYGSYLSRKENLTRSGISVAFADTAIAILAGLMIFPALFAGGATPEAGGDDVGIVFKVLPTIFDTLPAGTLFSILFYGLLAIAALTSSISLLEVVVSYFLDELKWSREKATWLLGTGCLLLAVPCAYSSWFMGIMVSIFFDYALAVGAFMICLFAGWRWGVPAAIKEMRAEGASFPGLPVWGFLIRFFCPVVAGLILLSRIWTAIAN